MGKIVLFYPGKLLSLPLPPPGVPLPLFPPPSEGAALRELSWGGVEGFSGCVLFCGVFFMSLVSLFFCSAASFGELPVALLAESSVLFWEVCGAFFWFSDVSSAAFFPVSVPLTLLSALLLSAGFSDFCGSCPYFQLKRSCIFFIFNIPVHGIRLQGNFSLMSGLGYHIIGQPAPDHQRGKGTEITF